MASNLKVALRNLTSYSKYAIVRRAAISGCPSRAYSNKTEEAISQNEREPKVGMSADGRVLISWHPEQTHPYQHTLPITHTAAEATEGGSVLKDQLVKNYMTRYRPSGPTIHELTNITHTTKHQWYPKPQKKFRKRNPPKDRDGI